TTVPTPTPPHVTATTDANCREGPSLEYAVIASLAEGTSAAVTGRNAESTWWQVTHPTLGITCWISGTVVQVGGDLGSVTVAAAPPLPPTAEPTSTNTLVPPPTPDTTPPVFSLAYASPDSILVETTGCPSLPRVTTVTADVSDENGISNIYATWTIGAENGSVTLVASGAVYEADIGPVNTAGTMSITIYATDPSGNVAQYGPLYVTVKYCVE
ncbi:MAG: SH3 domain-containing protein, partial [Anaerolineae bacterium]